MVYGNIRSYILKLYLFNFDMIALKEAYWILLKATMIILYLKSFFSHKWSRQATYFLKEAEKVLELSNWVLSMIYIDYEFFSIYFYHFSFETIKISQKHLK